MMIKIREKIFFSEMVKLKFISETRYLIYILLKYFVKYLYSAWYLKSGNPVF